MNLILLLGNKGCSREVSPSAQRKLESKISNVLHRSVHTGWQLRRVSKCEKKAHISITELDSDYQTSEGTFIRPQRANQKLKESLIWNEAQKDLTFSVFDFKDCTILQKLWLKEETQQWFLELQKRNILQSSFSSDFSVLWCWRSEKYPSCGSWQTFVQASVVDLSLYLQGMHDMEFLAYTEWFRVLGLFVFLFFSILSLETPIQVCKFMPAGPLHQTYPPD